MGCCCSKDNEQEEDRPNSDGDRSNSDERTRLLGSTSEAQKSRFVEPGGSTLGGGGINNPNYNRGLGSSNVGPNEVNSGIGGQQLEQGYQNQSNQNQMNNSQYNANNMSGYNNQFGENNQTFDKIIREVIHVSTFESRGSGQGAAGQGGQQYNQDHQQHQQQSYYNQNGQQQYQQVHDMPFRIKGLLEPSRQQQLSLPEGVLAPLSVLAAQPPFSTDIRLINTMASEAQMCINGYSLNVPENVAFDFNPIV